MKRLAISMIVTLALSSIATAASVRTTNFVVNAPSQQLAQQIGQAAEKYRHDLAIDWLGKELPTWQSPCPITAQVGEQLGAGGATSFVFDHGEVFGWRMTIQGSQVRILDSVLPHEVTHTVFATHFRRKLPRWADEGASTTVEHVSEKTKQSNMLLEFLRTDRGLSFSRMFAMTEYPRDVMQLYAHGYSLSDFLIEANGRQGFIGFLEDSFASSPESALTANYDYATLQQLQDAWLDWVRVGSPRAPASSSYRASGCPCYRWFPGKRLWNARPGFVFPRARQASPANPSTGTVAQPSIAPVAPAAPPYDPGQQVDSGGPLVDVPAPSGNSPIDQLRADFEAEKQRLLADAEAKLQSQTKALRDQLAAKAGVPPDVQAKIDTLVAQAEQHAADMAKQLTVNQNLQGVVNDLNSKLSAALPIPLPNLDVNLPLPGTGAAAAAPALSGLTGLIASTLGVAGGPAGVLAGVLYTLAGTGGLAGAWKLWQNRGSSTTVAATSATTAAPGGMAGLAAPDLSAIIAAIKAALPQQQAQQIQQAQQVAAAPSAPVVLLNDTPPPPQVNTTTQQFYAVETPTKNELAMQQAIQAYARKYPGAAPIFNQLQSWTDQIRSGMQQVAA